MGTRGVVHAEDRALTVKAGVQDDFFLRPPHWAPRDQVKAFVGSQAIPVQWSGDYVRFTGIKIGDELTIIYPLLGFLHEAGGIWKNGLPGVNVTYQWLGNMVVAVDPPAAEDAHLLARGADPSATAGRGDAKMILREEQ